MTYFIVAYLFIGVFISILMFGISASIMQDMTKEQKRDVKRYRLLVIPFIWLPWCVYKLGRAIGKTEDSKSVAGEILNKEVTLDK